MRRRIKMREAIIVGGPHDGWNGYVPDPAPPSIRLATDSHFTVARLLGDDDPDPVCDSEQEYYRCKIFDQPAKRGEAPPILAYVPKEHLPHA